MIIERCAHFYRKTIKYRTSNEKSTLKTLALKFALFIAKRRGFLPFFYTRNEEKFLRSSNKNPDSVDYDTIKHKITTLNNPEKDLVFQKKPLISIIILTRDNIQKLSKCLNALRSSTYNNYEIIFVTNSDKEKTIDFLKKTGSKVILYKEPFNYSKMNNLGAKQAKGDHFLFLNDDVEAINDEWLESMLSYSIQEKVGAVGALLLFPRSFFYPTTIQHAGVLIGIGGPAVHAFSFSHYDRKHYQNVDKTTRRVSAVTGACMMIHRTIFKAVEGFDEKFSVVFGDIDICLRIRKKGYDVIYDADAKMYHHEGSTRGISYPLEDEILFLKRWEDAILKGDECYSQKFSMIHRDFTPCPYPTDVPALSLLLEVYFFREDLQRRFPKMNEKNCQRLVDWAATEGVTKDIARTALVLYNRYYLENSSPDIKPLVSTIYRFNHDLALQKMFSEVFLGNYERLVSNLVENST